MNKKQPAVFLDRDGVLIEDTHYPDSFSKIIIIPDAVQALRILNEKEFRIIVISNQSGVARGLFPLDFVINTHIMLKNEFARQNAGIDEFYFCPHHPEGTIKEFSIACNCRKPKTGMIERAVKDFPVTLPESYMIGDKLSDLQTGLNAGISPILVKTGYGERTYEKNRSFVKDNDIPVFGTLSEAAYYIVSRIK